MKAADKGKKGQGRSDGRLKASSKIAGGKLRLFRPGEVLERGKQASLNTREGGGKIGEKYSQKRRRGDPAGRRGGGVRKEREDFSPVAKNGIS